MEHQGDARIISIDVQSVRKGDVIPWERVEHFYIHHIVGEQKYNQQVEEYQEGKRLHDPLGRASHMVAEHIMSERRALGNPVVCRTKQKEVQILTDADAIVYRSNRANSALGLHRKQTKSLHQDIDEQQLTPAQKSDLAHKREYHCMVEVQVAAAKRTLKAMGEGKLKLSGK